MMHVPVVLKQLNSKNKKFLKKLPRQFPCGFKRTKVKMEHIYMCVNLNPYEPGNHGCPSFYKNIFYANMYAVINAKTKEIHIPMVGLYHKRVTMCVCIFKIPFGTHIPIYNPDFSDDNDEIWDYLEKTVWDRKTSAARLIQNVYRQRFKSRVDSAKLIQGLYREAIANPYTQLCKNRLIREFNELC